MGPIGPIGSEQLMNLRFIGILCLSFLIAFTPCVSQAQNTAKTKTLERNIRAELGFLASDAMQGRGSGSGYERLAAEYIGSQFRQFGLEPAGDIHGTQSACYEVRIRPLPKKR